MKRRAVSIVELSIGIALLVLLATQVSLSTNLAAWTPKQEAEKMAKRLSSLMLKADKTQIPFTLEIESDKMVITWNTSDTSLVERADREKYRQEFPASSGCTYSWNAPNDKLTNNPAKNKFSQGATITIKGNGDPHYVIISTIGSRVRTSDTSPAEGTFYSY
ncbi:MAG: hypothetical protein IJS39_11925 [Synergistaceae bacterium]|nr:hypothetical protein [Synergistaceae bacterium]